MKLLTRNPMKLLTWGESLGNPGCPYLRRWVLDLGLFSIRLHHWLGSDDDRAYHDHSWWFIVLILKGWYLDHSPEKTEWMAPGTIRFRWAAHRHIVQIIEGDCWSLLLTGPSLRQWGFWVNGKWMKASRYFYKYKHHGCQ